MSRTVRLTGRFMNAADEVVDVVCSTANASVPPLRRQVGAGGDAEFTILPTAIMLYHVEQDSLAALRAGNWTHIVWPGTPDDPSRDLQVRQILIEGPHVRVIV